MIDGQLKALKLTAHKSTLRYSVIRYYYHLVLSCVTDTAAVTDTVSVTALQCALLKSLARLQ
jgi:hypothetical protein